MINNPVSEALNAYKIAMKAAIVIGGAPTLCVGSAKLVDAIDEMLQHNLGLAANDIWAGLASMLKVLVEAMVASDKKPVSQMLGNSYIDANNLYTDKQFKRASINYWRILKVVTSSFDDSVRALVAQELVNGLKN